MDKTFKISFRIYSSIPNNYIFQNQRAKFLKFMNCKHFLLERNRKSDDCSRLLLHLYASTGNNYIRMRSILKSTKIVISKVICYIHAAQIFTKIHRESS